MTGRDPGLDAAFENEGRISHRIQGISDEAAGLAAVLAVSHDRSCSRQRSCAITDLIGIAPYRARNQAWPRREVHVLAHVDDDWRIGKPESSEDCSGSQ